ncbi:MAG: hypothetical protein LBT50_00235 [Prevotellaceae bacterium]|jgi:hypothetical protein|nr:hypothetical protein [Prevotellaceae bacterium]
MKTFLNNILQCVGLLLCQATLFLAVSCNEDVLQHDRQYGASGTDYESGRVLMIVVDGASGQAVRTAVNSRNAQTIRSMMDYSVYTFDGLADSKTENDSLTLERGWANLMTGRTTHDVGIGDLTVEEMTLPSFISLAKQANPLLKTSLYASTGAFYNAFRNGVDKHSFNESDDVAVKNALVAELSANLPSDLVIAQLGTVQRSGVEEGFFEMGVEPVPTQNVIAAIRTVDTYISEIVQTLHARKNFDKENWLVVITSSYGGKYPNALNATAFYDYPDRNTFTMMYNPRFVSGLLQRPSDDELKYAYSTPVFVGRNATLGMYNAMMEDPTFFDMDRRQVASAPAYANLDSTEYTISFKMKDNRVNSSNNHSILSKRSGTSGNGWDIRFDGNYVRWDANNFRDGSYGSNVGGRSMRTASQTRRTGWHAYTFVWAERLPAADNNTARQCSDSAFIYVDGVLEDRKQMKGDQTMTILTIPVTIGNNNTTNSTNDNTEIMITDIQFYNVALPPQFIASNQCKTRLDDLGENYEYWDNLLAYYPNDREEDQYLPYIKDYSKYSSDSKRLWFNRQHGSFIPPTTGITHWLLNKELAASICPTPDGSYYQAVFNTVDIVHQTMQWLGINIRTEWGLEGIGWPIKYDYMNNE